MNDRKNDEAMDACRANSDDLLLPELRQLAADLKTDGTLCQEFTQRQRSDQLIADGLRQVPLSPARRARLLAGSRALPEATASPVSPPVGRARARDRRRLTIASLALMALTLLLVASLTARWLNPWRQVGPPQLARWAMQTWVPNSSAWRAIGELSVASQGAISQYLRVRPARWQILPTHLDEGALVFDFPGHTQPVHLFVLRAGRRVKRLPNYPPQQPQTSYEGRLFAAWQESRHVYVLSVAGSVQHYRDVVRTPGHSLADTQSSTAVR